MRPLGDCPGCTSCPRPAAVLLAPNDSNGSVVSHAMLASSPLRSLYVREWEVRYHLSTFRTTKPLWWFWCTENNVGSIQLADMDIHGIQFQSSKAWVRLRNFRHPVPFWDGYKWLCSLHEHLHTLTYATVLGFAFWILGFTVQLDPALTMWHEP